MKISVDNKKIKVDPSFMHNLYTLSYVTCAKCGKKISNTNNTPIFNNNKSNNAYIYKPTIGNSVDYDPHNLPNEDEVGAIFVPTISPEGDDEGYNWKNYCKSCWNNLKDKDDEWIYNNTGISDYC